MNHESSPDTMPNQNYRATRRANSRRCRRTEPQSSRHRGTTSEELREDQGINQSRINKRTSIGGQPTGREDIKPTTISHRATQRSGERVTGHSRADIGHRPATRDKRRTRRRETRRNPQSSTPPPSMTSITAGCLRPARFRRDHEMLVGRRICDGDNGFQVITPLERTGGERILVNCGWISKKLKDHNIRDRDDLRMGEIAVAGLLRSPLSSRIWTRKPTEGHLVVQDGSR
jgi:hypothetical protein